MAKCPPICTQLHTPGRRRNANVITLSPVPFLMFADKKTNFLSNCFNFHVSDYLKEYAIFFSDVY